MSRCVLYFLVFATSFCSAAQSPKETPPVNFKDRIAGLQKQDGFLPYYWDVKKGVLLFELSPATREHEFLYFTALGSGIGSTKTFADRSSIATNALCRFRQAGARVLVIEENSAFRAETGSPALKKSVELSFPISVLASLPVEAEQDGTLLVNANPLLIRDATDLLSQLRRPTQAVNGVLVRQEGRDSNWKLDESRSVIDLDSSGSFPLNTEIEALLTFTNEGETDFNQPDAHVLSLRQHHSFVALPGPGYEAREADPRVGFDDLGFQDFSQPFNRPLKRRHIQRWRLEKKDPSAAISEPVKPIIFYLDRAVPEPMRSALKRGALWWNTALEQAGFKDALHIEDLPEGASPLDVRYPTLQWTNRSGRGWSVGMTQSDPRTGEIVHAIVQLDSHRMRTMNNYWESTVPSGKGNEEPALDAFSALDNLDPELSEEQAMLNRIALLTCHEMGHVLGLDHNFVASTFGRGSVMDYYAPRVKIRSDGSADLSDAYMQGTGTYDNYAIEWGYSQGTPGSTVEQERARLDGIVRRALAKGIVWGNEADPRWNAYDDGPDPVAWLKQVWTVRDALLSHYGPTLLRPGEPGSRLASRFPLIYLFHRYALSAAINVIGSAKIPPSVVGDGQQPIVVWPAASQREALQLLVKALEPKELEISANLWKLLAPPEPNRDDTERFPSSAGYLFSPQDGARAVAEIVVGGLLDPQRMQRVVVIEHASTGALSPSEVVSALVGRAFSAARGGASSQDNDIASAVQTQVAERLILLSADASATPEVQSAALAGVYDVQKIVHAQSDPTARRLKREIELFLSNPQQNAPKLKPSGAPPGPPV
ncbi:MAG: zinc-dependent metalloprotease [Terriglobales bacterium]